MDVAGVLMRIKDRNPSWRLSEKRLKEVRANGLADGVLAQPRHEMGRQMKPDEAEVRQREMQYVFRNEWRQVGRATVSDLTGTFVITSGA